MKTAPKRKRSTRKRPEDKGSRKNRRVGRSMKKAKTLSDFLDEKIQEKEKAKEKQIDTFAKEELICPYCGWSHDPEIVGKKQSGLVKCGDCGEAFEFEATKRVVYSTSVP